MRNQISRLFSAIVLGIAVLVMLAPAAKAQERCVPFGGTIYGWLTDHWAGVGDLTVDRKTWHTNLSVDTLSVVDGGDTWTGNEIQTFDFGKGHILQGSGTFVTEHMTDPGGSGGVFHISEEGPFIKGKGIFKHVYGHWILEGAFGPGVKLPDKIQPPPEASWFFIAQYSGTICGMKDGD
jgi:hypothetical protein